MEEKELRIGNLINTEFGIRKVLGIFCDGVIQLSDGNETVIEESEPIPLTEEWLLRFGFELMSYGYRLNNFYIWNSNDEFEYLSIQGSIEEYITIESVHKLQNLYFALTGEELTFKTDI